MVQSPREVAGADVEVPSVALPRPGTDVEVRATDFPPPGVDL